MHGNAVNEITNLGSFLQWYNSFPSGKRFFYSCGSDRALVEETLRAELSYRPISALDFVVHEGSEHISEIMASLGQFSKGGMRVIVIKNADKIKDWDPIVEWSASKEMKNTHLLCTGSDVKPNTKQPHLRIFFTKGKFVECKPLAVTQFVDYIVSKGRFTPEAAKALVKRTAGSSARILNELHKFEYLPPPITVELVNTYVEIIESEQFVKALLENDKRLAMQIAANFDEEDFNSTIGSLEYALSNMLLLHATRTKYIPLTDRAALTGVPVFLIENYLELMKGVAMDLLCKRIKLTANAEALYRTGVTVESILARTVALW